MSAISVQSIRNVASGYIVNEVDFNENNKVISFTSVNGTRINIYYSKGTVSTFVPDSTNSTKKIVTHLKNQSVTDLVNTFNDIFVPIVPTSIPPSLNISRQVGAVDTPTVEPINILNVKENENSSGDRISLYKEEDINNLKALIASLLEKETELRIQRNVAEQLLNRMEMTMKRYSEDTADDDNNDNNDHKRLKI